MPIVSRRQFWAMVFAAKGQGRRGIPQKVARRYLRHNPGAARRYRRKRRRKGRRARRKGR